MQRFHVLQDPPYPLLFFTSASQGYSNFRDFGRSINLLEDVSSELPIRLEEKSL
jgi:hypothetical protein